MKKLVKIAISLCLCVACVFSVLSFSACGESDLVDVIVAINVNGENKELNITLDKESAPKTVEHITKLIESGYYKDAFFYTMTDSSYSNQIMFGDLKFDNGEIVQMKAGDKFPDIVTGEFANGAIKGSELKNVEGSIGLWRTWVGNYTNSNGNDTGRATLYMPTGTIESYDGYFCVFGSFDLVDENVKAIWNAIVDAVKTTEEDKFENYTIYYTKEDKEFKAVKNSDYKSANAYVPESYEPQNLKAYKIKVPVINKSTGTIDAGVKISSIKIAD